MNRGPRGSRGAVTSAARTMLMWSIVAALIISLPATALSPATRLASLEASRHVRTALAASAANTNQPPPTNQPARGFSKPPPRSQNLLIVGLGNPGNEYDGTRHNVGFAALDAFATAYQGVLKSTSKFGADYGAVRIGNKNVGLLKPTTYINNSGKPLKAIMTHFKLTAADILVLADDVGLEVGDVQLKGRGSHGGHNGHRDIEAVLGTREYARVRIGVGAPPGGRGALVEHVLGAFSGGEAGRVEEALARCSELCREWCEVDDLTNVRKSRLK